MREIKFRGYSIEPLCADNQWIEGFGVFAAVKSDGSKGYFLYTVSGKYQVYEESIGESTGLYDKNENAIYEGDILQDTDEGGQYQVSYNEDLAGFQVVSLDRDQWTDWLYDYHDCVAIGNRFENLELVESSNEQS